MQTDRLLQHSLKASTHITDLLLSRLEQLITWLLTSGVRMLIIFVLAWTAVRLLRGLTTRLHKMMVGSASPLEQIKRADTVIGMLNTISAILVVATAAMMMLRETGIDIAPVLATAGVGGLAIGFGAQTLVKDVISGFFMLLEGQIRIGDVVEVAGKRGVVEGMSLRTIRLRDLPGDVHIVPNGNISVVTNMTRDYSRYVVEAQVARREDPERVFEALREVGEQLQKDARYADDILQPIEILGVDAVGAATITVKARLTTRAIKQWRVGREFNRRMVKRFEELGIAAT
jgi:moderate conductance mechanosensitive channel